MIDEDKITIIIKILYLIYLLANSTTFFNFIYDELIVKLKN